MTAAGTSAGLESRRHSALADAHERAASEERAAAGRYGVAEVTEARVAIELSQLSAFGYYLLPDRGWPGSRSANVDLIVVGPGGVFIVDTKAWKEVRVAGGRIYRDQADVSDDLAPLADLGRNTDGLLAEHGLAPNEVHSVAVLAGHRNVRERVGPVDILGEFDVRQFILRKGNRLTAAQVDAVFKVLLDHFPVMRPTSVIDTTITEPVLAAEPNRAEAEVDSAPALIGADEITEAALEGVLREPIETWMSFLDPTQAKLVRRSFNGPARIRGSAGTGKTVVGLHRAAYLARGGAGKVLFATYTKSLPRVFENLLGRMEPELGNRVEFTGIHAFATRLLRDRGVPLRIVPKAPDASFAEAWAQQPTDSPLRSKAVPQKYWRDEIDHVIKGRGITHFDQYADLARVGRRHRLTVDQRRAVWSLFEAYDAAMQRRSAHDWADVVLLALHSVRATPLKGYSAVIVDEAQDLSCAMVALLHSLVGNETDGFTLIGDGQQTIYPGGYTLSELGISLAGRGVVLTVNHRNTAEILEFANAMIEGDEFADIEGATERQDVVATVPRTGPPPVVEHYASRRQHDQALVAHVRSVLELVGTSLGDVGVLTSTHRHLDQVRAALKAAGLPVIDLEKYDGRPTDAIKIGTVKRAKGLEFKQVLLAMVDPRLLGPAPTEASDVERERRGLDRRELYVAMTRARDGLWLGATV